MGRLARALASSLIAACCGRASLVVVVPATGATAVCADRRFYDGRGNRYDADNKLRLLPHAAWFVIGLAAVSTKDQLLYSPAEAFERFLAERATSGVNADAALADDKAISLYLRSDFERFLRETAFPAQRTTKLKIEPSFSLGIVRLDHSTPHLSVITISRVNSHAAKATSGIDHGLPQMFSHSDPLYVGEMEVVMSLAKREPDYARFNHDPYVKKFLLANFGMPLADLDSSLKAARRLISVTAEGLAMKPRAVPTVSGDSVCAVLDYESGTVKRIW